MLFGTGIVKTAEDFGTQGEPPSHPELLDWLAVEFMRAAAGTSSHMLRLMVTSAAYRQSSARDAGAVAQRPGEPAARPRPARSACRRSSSATRRWRSAGCSTTASAAPSVSPYQPAGPVGRADEPLRRRQLDRADLHAEPRPRPVPADDVHVLEADQPPADADDVRRPRPRDLHRPPRPHQHAAAGAGADERPDLRRGQPQARRADDARGPRHVAGGADRLRLPPGHGPRATAAGDGGPRRPSSTSRPSATRRNTPRTRRSCSASASPRTTTSSTRPSWRRGRTSRASC